MRLRATTLVPDIITTSRSSADLQQPQLEQEADFMVTSATNICAPIIFVHQALHKMVITMLERFIPLRRLVGTVPRIRRSTLSQRHLLGRPIVNAKELDQTLNLVLCNAEYDLYCGAVSALQLQYIGLFKSVPFFQFISRCC